MGTNAVEKGLRHDEKPANKENGKERFESRVACDSLPPSLSPAPVPRTGSILQLPPPALSHLGAVRGEDIFKGRRFKMLVVRKAAYGPHVGRLFCENDDYDDYYDYSSYSRHSRAISHSRA